MSSDRIYPTPSCPDPNEIVQHCDGCESFHIISDDSADIAMFSDGACSDNGKSTARGGIGVYYTCDDDLNISLPLPGTPQTSQRAELYGTIYALRQARRFEQDGYFVNYDGLVIITDSAYVVNVMTNWIYRWKRNGWMTSNGNRVANVDDIKELDRNIRFLEKKNVSVRFWKVDREYNDEADRLAREGISKHST
ncbi:Ribonuclease H1 [Leucoagaricus sp. SymC.cos]|nr:Ribonuclease H1 [Leucoagaricus sp. SymC.cos]